MKATHGTGAVECVQHEVVVVVGSEKGQRGRRGPLVDGSGTCSPLSGDWGARVGFHPPSPGPRWNIVAAVCAVAVEAKRRARHKVPRQPRVLLTRLPSGSAQLWGWSSCSA